MSNQPSKELWKALYEITNKIKLLKPWNNFYDMDIITIKLPNREEPVFCSIMGALGECFGIGVYQGYSELSNLFKIAEMKDIPYSILMSYQNCLICNFDNRNELAEEDIQVLRDLGLRFRGDNNWIFFRSHKTGYYPWFINSEECELLIETFQNLYMAILAKNKGLTVDFNNGETLMREYSKERNEWLNYGTLLPRIPFAYDAVSVDDELLIKKLKMQKKTSFEIECELFFPNFPIQENKTQRPYFPKTFALADINTQMIDRYEIISPEEDEIQVILGILIDYILNHGRPRTIYVRDERMVGILEDFCKKIDVKLSERTNLIIIDDFIVSMENMNQF